MPRLSIITVNYNNAAGLQKTIEGVIAQTFKDIQYIVIDGGSTDDSVEVVKKFSDKIDYWISEKDDSDYEAMNKGIVKATGEYYMFLNSGDYLFDSKIIEQIIPLLTGELIIYGNLEICEPQKKWIKTYPDELLFSYFIEDTLPHSGGIFIHHRAFKNELSFYDDSLRIVADWKWFLLAIFKYDYSYKHINKTVGIFDYSGMSSKPENHVLINTRKQKVLEKYFPLLYKDMQNLLTIKKKYNDLLNSRFVKFYLSLKKKSQFQK